MIFVAPRAPLTDGTAKAVPTRIDADLDEFPLCSIRRKSIRRSVDFEELFLRYSLFFLEFSIRFA
jgi:hypothetical protein